MTTEELKAHILASMPTAEVFVEGDGYHFEAIVISDEFAGLSAVKKQQRVYQSVQNEITSGNLHALSIKTYTPEEWGTRGQSQNLAQ